MNLQPKTVVIAGPLILGVVVTAVGLAFLGPIGTAILSTGLILSSVPVFIAVAWLGLPSNLGGESLRQYARVDWIMSVVLIFASGYLLACSIYGNVDVFYVVAILISFYVSVAKVAVRIKLDRARRASGSE
ncbi:MAG: hypothetical protein R3E01_10260 [Pirellulaceae bacterium]